MEQNMSATMQSTSDASALAGARPQSPPDLSKLKGYAEEARDMTMDARKLSERDRVYYDDFDDSQWTTEQKATLRRRKQPPAVQNWIRIAINGMLGVVERMQTDPKALPRSQDKDNAADVATKALRFIADENRLDRLKVRAARNFFVEGTCAAVIEVEPQQPDYRIVIRRVSHREHFADPFSQEEDYSDARYQGIAKWMEQSVVEALYPNKAADIQAALSDASLWSPNDQDRPNKGWVNKRAKRLLVVEMYHKEGIEWQRCVFIGSAVLEYGPSPYMDADGKTTCAIEAQSFAKNLDNYAYGAVRSMISTQDMINKRMSKLMHLLNTRQTFGTKAALGEDVSKIKQELASPDGHVELNHGTFGQDFGIIPVNDQVAGQFQLLQNDLSFMDRVLPNPGILGRDNKGQSGVAMQSAQDAGMTELADPFGGLTDWELRIYRQSWARAKQFWTAPRWIRVADEIGAIEMLQVNVPVVDEIGAVMGPDGQPQMERALAQLEVDIILDAQPEQLTQQAEQFQILAKMPIPPKIMIQLSGLDGKTKRLALESLEEAEQSQSQQPSPEMLKLQSDEKMKMGELALRKDEQDQRMQMESQKASADGQKLQADLNVKAIEAQIKMRELEIKSQELELKQQELTIKEREMAVNVQIETMRTAAARDTAMFSEQSRAAESNKEREPKDDKSGEAIGRGLEALAMAMSKPKRLVRGEDGKAMGIE